MSATNPLVHILRFGFQPFSGGGTGTDFRHLPRIIAGLPVSMVRFGFQPVGTPTGPAGTDFRHEPHILMGLPVHMVRFGRQPVGSGAPAAGKTRNHPFFATPGQLMHR